MGILLYSGTKLAIIYSGQFTVIQDKISAVERCSILTMCTNGGSAQIKGLNNLSHAWKGSPKQKRLYRQEEKENVMVTHSDRSLHTLTNLIVTFTHVYIWGLTTNSRDRHSVTIVVEQ